MKTRLHYTYIINLSLPNINLANPLCKRYDDPSACE